MEQWLPDYDSCRLFALNFFSFVVHPFTKNAYINYDLLYHMAYVQQRLADNLINLEVERIDAIIEKINSDPEPEEVKRTERELWLKVRKVTLEGRRTGCGFTGLGDMIAALGLKYDSPEAMEIMENVARVKFEAELDCSIDLAVLRGAFPIWDLEKEFDLAGDSMNGYVITGGKNDFYEMLCKEYSEKVYRMGKYGRRNISWSTVAPTGTVSIVAKAIKSPNISGGIEPQFACYYFRNKKVNPNDKDVRVDFKDQNGDAWQQYPVVMGAFRDWYNIIEPTGTPIELLTKEEIETYYKASPWYESCADDIDWVNRVKIQAIFQKYITNAISSTVNLPSDVSKEKVSEIYWAAWKAGLKGITVYRDGSRSGVLVKEEINTKEVAFSTNDAVKRPKVLPGEGYLVMVKGVEYIVMVGLLDGKPYEVFASQNQWSLPKHFDCEIIKKGSGKYNVLVKDIMLIEDFSHQVTDEESAICRLSSTALRHGTDVKYVVEQLMKTEGNMVSFTKALVRILKKYITEGAKSSVKCQDCGGTNVIFKEGCNICQSCGTSRCG